MAKPRQCQDIASLIPELRAWNKGAGIRPDAWISHVGSYELAVGYSLVFWPTFVLFEGYVLREGFSEVSLRSWQQAASGNRQAVEAMMNHIHLADIHAHATDVSEDQLRYLGRVLRETYTAKLKADFPSRLFEVAFNDEPELHALDYELTFWQTSS